MGQAASSCSDPESPVPQSSARGDGKARHRKRIPPAQEGHHDSETPSRVRRNQVQGPGREHHRRRRTATASTIRSENVQRFETNAPRNSPGKRKQESRVREAEDYGPHGRNARPQVHRESSHRTTRHRRSSHPNQERAKKPKDSHSKVKFESKVDIIEYEDSATKESQHRGQAHGRNRKKEVRDCLICTETRSTRHFPKRNPTMQCAHDINTCRHCLRTWIESEFSSKMWGQLKCPECSAQMEYADVRDAAPSHILRRYERLSARAAMEAIPGFRWCIAKGCKSGQVHEGDFTPRFRCVACHASHCVVHEVKWHKGETCAAYDYRTNESLKKAENEASKKLIRQMAKKCPGCKWNIEKNDGCDHMTCSKCHHEFCWLCMAPYDLIIKHGNRMHRRDCEYFSE